MQSRSYLHVHSVGLEFLACSFHVSYSALTVSFHLFKTFVRDKFHTFNRYKIGFLMTAVVQLRCIFRNFAFLARLIYICATVGRFRCVTVFMLRFFLFFYLFNCSPIAFGDYIEMLLVDPLCVLRQRVFLLG